MVSAVRAQVCQALRMAEVLAPLVEDRGPQQGWPTPATVYQRRNFVATRLRAALLALWGRAVAAVADTGLSSLRDDDEEPAVRDLPLPYTLGVTGNIAMLLEELADAVARDQQYLDGLGPRLRKADCLQAEVPRAFCGRSPVAGGTGRRRDERSRQDSDPIRPAAPTAGAGELDRRAIRP